jgi:hypothetical protein
MAGKRISGLGAVTDILTTDYVELYRPTESLKADQNKKILLPNFMGGTTGIPFDIAVERSGANSTITLTRTGAATAFLNASTSYGQFGTNTAHPARILVNSINKFAIATTGIITSTNTYGHDVNGETFVPVQITDGGEFGFDSSTLRVKADIKDMPKSKADGIYSLRPVTYKPKKNLNKPRMGLIAEEVAPLFPEAVFYHIYKVVGGELVRPDISEYDETSWQDIKSNVEKNIEKTITVKKIKKRDKDGSTIETEDVDEVFTAVEEGINWNELISPMIKAIQDLKAEVELLKAT